MYLDEIYKPPYGQKKYNYPGDLNQVKKLPIGSDIFHKPELQSSVGYALRLALRADKDKLDGYDGCRPIEYQGRLRECTAEIVEEYLNKYFLKPCESFLKEAAMKRALEFGEVIAARDSEEGLEGDHPWLKWVCRGMICEWARSQTVENLAEMLLEFW